jgi:hypothetical protein
MAGEGGTVDDRSVAEVAVSLWRLLDRKCRRGEAPSNTCSADSRMSVSDEC